MDSFLWRATGRTRKALVVPVLLAVVWTNFGAHVPRAHAQEAVYDAANTIQSTISAAADVALVAIEKSLFIKEWTLDGIAFGLAKKALQQITKSTLRWIHSGFQGSPMFVTDLEGFLAQSADEIAGEFIYGSDLAFLCSPFELKIRLSLDYSLRPFRDEVQCTLSDAVGNVDRFLGGDFLAGGWRGWFELTTNPMNHPFGVYGAAQIELNGRISERIQREVEKLRWGAGFLAVRECETVVDPDGSTHDHCIDTTPGHVIADQLTFELKSGQLALIEADEINEIIGALFAQLSQQALQGAAGILGLGRTGGSYGSVSYLDRLDNPAYDTTTGVPVGSEDFIGSAIADENAYRALYARVVSRTEALIVRVEELREGGRCLVSGSYTQRIEDILKMALREQGSADENLLLLRSMQTRYALAELEEQQLIVEEFALLQASTRLHSSITNARDKFEVDELLSELDGIQSQITQSCPAISGSTGTQGE